MTNSLYEENEVFGGWFNHWRKVRVKKIEDVLGQDWFKGKKILELGAGFGNVGLYFKSLGADVTMSDARSKCLEAILKKDKDANVILLDQDSKWELPEQYDLIIKKTEALVEAIKVNKWDFWENSLEYKPDCIIWESGDYETFQDENENWKKVYKSGIQKEYMDLVKFLKRCK